MPGTPETIQDETNMKDVMQACDDEADIWSEKVGLDKMVPIIKNESESLRDFAKQCFVEGMYHGVMNVKSRMNEDIDTGWHPIETAPKDGIDILVWGPKWKYECVSWEDVPHHPWVGENVRFPSEAFTHWGHLPAAPRDKDEEDAP